jgi:hypothetical protein
VLSRASAKMLALTMITNLKENPVDLLGNLFILRELVANHN